MLGWSIRARACRSDSNRARTVRESMPGLISFRATCRLDRLDLLGEVDGAHAPLADLLAELVAAGDDRADEVRAVVARPGERRGRRRALPATTARSEMQAPRTDRRPPIPGSWPSPRERPRAPREGRG